MRGHYGLNLADARLSRVVKIRGPESMETVSRLPCCQLDDADADDGDGGDDDALWMCQLGRPAVGCICW